MFMPAGAPKFIDDQLRDEILKVIEAGHIMVQYSPDGELLDCNPLLEASLAAARP